MVPLQLGNCLSENGFQLRKNIRKQASRRKIDAYSNSDHSGLNNLTSKECLIEDTKKEKRRNARVCIYFIGSKKRWKATSESGDNIALQSDLVLLKATDGPMYINLELKSQIK